MPPEPQTPDPAASQDARAPATPDPGAFLRPTWVKAVFLVEWAAFVAINVAGGHLRTTHVALVAAYPFAFYYLVACALAAWSRRRERIGGTGRLLAIGTGIVVAEQAIKSLVAAFVPLHTSLPLVDGWLRLANQPNPYGSWVAAATGVMPTGAVALTNWIGISGVFVVSAGAHRFYVTTQRHSLWADVAFLGVYVGSAGWMCDMGFRGHIADFINLPGLTTCDLKDIAIGIGAAACLAEVLDHPRLDWRWRGWRTEAKDTVRWGRELGRFAAGEWRGVVRWVGGRGRDR